MVRGCVIFFEPATFQKGSYFIVHHPQLSQSLCVFILFNVFLVFFGFFFCHAASFRVVSQSSPPATIRIVVFLNFEYSFYSFFSVFFCTCEGFFFVSGLKSTLWAIMALWAILALWFFWMFFNSFFPHVRDFFGFFLLFFSAREG